MAKNKIDTSVLNEIIIPYPTIPFGSRCRICGSDKIKILGKSGRNVIVQCNAKTCKSTYITAAKFMEDKNEDQ